MSAAKPKDKATKAFHPDLPEEDARFDPINLEKERLNEEDEGQNRKPKAGIPLGRFEALSPRGVGVKSRTCGGWMLKLHGTSFPTPGVR